MPPFERKPEIFPPGQDFPIRRKREPVFNWRNVPLFIAFWVFVYGLSVLYGYLFRWFEPIMGRIIQAISG